MRDRSGPGRKGGSTRELNCLMPTQSISHECPMVQVRSLHAVSGTYYDGTY